jgi:SAM-dependent methyltransferase
MAYQFEHTWEKERERLRAIERGDAATMDALVALGVAEGWRCLEVGAGAGSIARWLCERVGASGRVVATDLEVNFLGEIEAGNLEVRRHDILIDPLEPEAYDLAHARKVLEHLPQHDLALRRMLAALRHGGWICVEDADLLAIRHVDCANLARFERCYQAFVATMQSAGYQPRLGLQLGAQLRALGVRDVRVRGSTSEWPDPGGAPSTWILTLEKLRDRVVAQGRLAAHEYDEFLAEARSPAFHAITGIHFIAWGRKP